MNSTEIRTVNYRDHLILTGIPIREALIQLNKLAKNAILFVVDDRDILIGSLTDGDVRRGLINAVEIDSPVNDIIQKNPRYIKRGDYDIKKVIEFREGNFKIIPIVDKDGRVVNVINFGEIRSYLPVDAVIMAGGRGKRLSPLTDNTPKPLLKVGDLPIMEHNINRLALYGIADFWVSLNYLGEQIENYFGNGMDRNLNIRYIREAEPMGTIGSVSLINSFEHDYVLITNSDLLTNLDYEHFFLNFLESEADISVVTIPYQVNIPYGVMETSNGHIISFKEKPTYTYYSNGGIYLVKRSVLDLLPKKQFFDATDLIAAVLKKEGKVHSYPLMGYWLDIGNPEDYQKANKDLQNVKF